MLHFKFAGLLVINSCKLKEKGVGGYIEYLYFKDHANPFFLTIRFWVRNGKNPVENEWNKVWITFISI